MYVMADPIQMSIWKKIGMKKYIIQINLSIE